MKEKDIEYLISIYCTKNGIDIEKGFPKSHRNELMKYLADHKKVEDRKKRKQKMVEDRKISNILEGVIGRL